MCYALGYDGVIITQPSYAVFWSYCVFENLFSVLIWYIKI